jgi:putative transposase
MPRISRVVVPEMLYHITQRGNYRQDIFEGEEDKQVYMDFFQLYAKKYKVKLFAFCLMDNHVHFVVEPQKEDSLALLFKYTHMRYSMYFNKKKGSPGHLFQGRFFSCLLYEEHLYEAIRYVELNPIRSNIVADLEDYYWSSAYTRLTGNIGIKLNSIREYLEIDDWKAYLQEPVDEGKIEKLKLNTKTGRPLGSDKFIAKLEKKLGIKITIESPGRKKK